MEGGGPKMCLRSNVVGYNKITLETPQMRVDILCVSELDLYWEGWRLVDGK